MSHSVIITLNNLQNTTNTCDSLLTQLNDSLKYNWSEETKILINNHINVIKKEKEKILSMVGQNYNDMTLDKVLSNISKEIENLNMSLNFKNLYDNHIKENAGKIEELIATHGMLATESISQLIINKEKINPETLTIKINEMRKKNVSHENLIKYQNIFKTNILNSNLTDDIKLQFINLATKFKNTQEISDIQPFIASKIVEFNNMKIMVNDVVNILRKLNFKLDSKNSYKLDEEQVFNLKLIFKNSANNSIAINFNSNGQIKYKLGNYIGHACEQTTDKLLNELTKMNYTYPKPLIRRDVDKAKPITKTYKERER